MTPARSSPAVFILLLCALANLHCRSNADGRSAAGHSSGVPVLGTVATFSLIDHFGRQVDSRELDEFAWVTTVTFSRSRSNSPQQISVMADLRDRIDQENLWHSVRLVNLTAEPEHDTPEVLQDQAREAGADSLHWRFLTGEREQMAALIESLGLTLLDDAANTDGPLTLSPKFVLVDRLQRVRGLYDIYDAEQLDNLTRDLGVVLEEAPHLDDGTGRTHLIVPAENQNLSWIDTRRSSQMDASEGWNVFSDFRFRDRLPESGITFRNKIVDNAGKFWMPNHYDHGNGVAIADVDGDGLFDLYFTTQVGANELWRNTGGGRFENVTEDAGVGLAERIGVSASFADIDNDGDPDLYVTTVKGGNALFLNDGDGTFTDISARSGTDYEGHPSAAVFLDYDRDGLLDLLVLNVGIYTTENEIPVTNGTSDAQTAGRYTFYEGMEDAFAAHIKEGRSEASILFRNLGDGRFDDVTREVGLVDDSWSGDATPIDANDDGWQDLYILNMQGDDQFYENVGGERFVRRSRELFPQTPWGSMGAKSFDFDNDGRMDLYLTDMHSDMSEDVGTEREKMKSRMQWPDTLLAGGGDNIFGNALFRRTSADDFEEISDEIGAENYWPWGLSVGDLNADGYDDVFIASSMNFPFRYGANSVLLNERGEGFVDAEYVLGVEPRRENRTVTPWFELDCGGADRDHEYCLQRDGDVVVWGAVGSRASVVFDLDGDGDLDIVTNDFNSEPQVLVSDLSERLESLSFLKVRLEGTESNRDALGARVTVRSNGEAYTKVMDGVTGYLSHGIHPLYFGLDGTAQIDRVEVRWPSGRRQVVDGPIEPNITLAIREE